MRPLVPEDINTAALTSLGRAAIMLARSIITETHVKAKDDRAVSLLLRAPTRQLTTSDASVLQPIAVVFLTLLTQVSAGAKFLSSGLQLNFDNGPISCPTLAVGEAKFINEAAPIPVVQNPVSKTDLQLYKLGAITVLTNEMVLGSNAEALMQQGMIDSAAPALDRVLFSTSAGVPGLQPPGLCTGPSLPPTAGGGTNALIADTASLVDAIAKYAGNANIVFVMAAKQYVAASMAPQQFPFPLLMSAALPAGTVICAASNAIVSAIEAPRIEAAKSTVLHYEDATPKDIVDIGGVMAFPVRSSYQIDAVSLRMIMPVSWALRAPGAVSWMQNVTW
jgi:hypothetical protein